MAWYSSVISCSPHTIVIVETWGKCFRSTSQKIYCKFCLFFIINSSRFGFLSFYTGLYCNMVIIMYIALWLVSFPTLDTLSSTPLQSLTTLLFSTSHYLTSISLALINDTLNLTRITCVTTGLRSSNSPGFNCDPATEDSECHSFKTHQYPVIQP